MFNIGSCCCCNGGCEKFLENGYNKLRNNGFVTLQLIYNIELLTIEASVSNVSDG